MLYKAKKDTTLTEYQGESFSKAFGKRTKDEWLDNETAHYVLTEDSTGTIISEGDLTRSVDKLSLSFIIGKSITLPLEGSYTLIVYQTDLNVVEFNEKMKEYKIKYKTRRVG